MNAEITPNSEVAYEEIKMLGRILFVWRTAPYHAIPQNELETLGEKERVCIEDAKFTEMVKAASNSFVN